MEPRRHPDCEFVERLARRRSRRRDASRTRSRGRLRYFMPVQCSDARPVLEVEAVHEPGRAALPRRPLPITKAARQRRPTEFMVPMRDQTIV